MGLPPGLLPKDVKSYNFSGSGLLQVFLDGPCLTKFDTMAFYESELRANLTYGSLTGVVGLSQEELFLWLPVKDIIVDDLSSGLILIDIGVAHKQLSLSYSKIRPIAAPKCKDLGIRSPDLLYWNASLSCISQLGYRPSWSWRSILESRSIILLGARRLIRSGSSTRIWLDPWIPRSSDFFAHPIGIPDNTLATVNSIVDVENFCWKEDIVHTMFEPEDASLILSIPIAVVDSDDLWCWHHNKNGKFSVKSAYHLATHSDLFLQHLSPSGSSTNPVWKKIWSFEVPPRFKMFAWRCASAALATMDNLAAHHIISSDICPLCQVPEDANHIFFECDFAKSVLRASGIFEVIFTFKQDPFAAWFQDILLHSPREVGCLFLVLSNLIWYHRNRRKFEGLSSDHLSIVMSANSILRDFLASNSIPSVFSDRPHQSSPTAGFPRICFDGAISSQTASCGIGISAFDSNGLFLCGLSKKVRGIIDPEIAEFLALKEALLLASSLNLQSTSIFGDAAQVVLAANNQTLGSSASSGILQDIFSIASRVHIKGIFWFSRSCNFVSHFLAQFAKNMDRDTFLWDQLPEPLCQSLLDDFQHY
ncbi:hypothetical protein DH2020_033555 [Rehmannia glutinosa]|uniref:Uncharacterized protein n=1 Tax=Rehmannia glutinosa TaxID=99300 RepID=A0ABR0VEC5_REHGL